MDEIHTALVTEAHRCLGQNRAFDAADAMSVIQPILARMTHERLHWQSETERFNKIVHAQRDRIRDLEGSPDRLLLRKMMTFFQSIGESTLLNLPQQAYVEAKGLQRQLQEVLK